jgi:hypothetical protein
MEGMEWGGDPPSYDDDISDDGEFTVNVPDEFVSNVVRPPKGEGPKGGFESALQKMKKPQKDPGHEWDLVIQYQLGEIAQLSRALKVMQAGDRVQQYSSSQKPIHAESRLGGGIDNSWQGRRFDGLPGALGFDSGDDEEATTATTDEAMVIRAMNEQRLSSFYAAQSGGWGGGVCGGVTVAD